MHEQTKETSMMPSSSSEAEKKDENSPAAKTKDPGLWRDLASYWIFGLCNNFGYVVMLTAAHAIIELIENGEKEGGHSSDGTTTFAPPTTLAPGVRKCNVLSTGAVLLADVIPGLIVKSMSPLLPFWNATRITVSCTVAICGFLMVALAASQQSLWMALFGIGMTSAASGLGEPTFLAYSAFFNKNVISTWSSGTGGAGIVGALAYTLLSNVVGLKPNQTMLVMIAVPAIELIVFFFVLRKPSSLRIEDQDIGEDVAPDAADVAPMRSLKEKLLYIKKLLRYMLPLGFVYFFEYLINQGMFELIYFPDYFLNGSQQYEWYQVTYQVGVFVSRSSVNIFHIKYIWIMAILQGLNVVFFFFEAVYMFTPHFWIIIVLVFYEGLLGGGGYVNTFYRMSTEVPATRREYSMSIVALSDSIGIMMAGFLAMPLHNWLCGLTGPRLL